MPDQSALTLIPILQGFLWGFGQVTIAYIAGYSTIFIAFRRVDFGKEDIIETMWKRMRIVWPDRFVRESSITGHQELLGFDRDEMQELWSTSSRAVESAKRLSHRLETVHEYLPRVGFAVIAGVLLGLSIGLAVSADLIEIPRLLWGPVFGLSCISFVFEILLPQSRDYQYVSRYLGKLDKRE